jgi:hypothetical protein
MWIPKNEREIIDAACTGNLTETAIFDAKRELPGSSKELAKDVAAMSTDGGVLLYGLGEDAQKRLTVLSPLPLAGVRERITSIVRTCIAEPPDIDVLPPIPTASDPSIGYIVVLIPASMRAPHMLVVDKDHRYYGRSATGNIILSEGEVARLYARRMRIEGNLDDDLGDVITRAPIPVTAGFSYLHILVEPVFSDRGLLERARASLPGDRTYQDYLGNVLLSSEMQNHFRNKYEPSLRSNSRWHRIVDGWETFYDGDRTTSLEHGPDGYLRLEVLSSGRITLFCGRAAAKVNEHRSPLIFEELVAGLTSHCILIGGTIYDHSEYVGPVNVGVALTNLQGAKSFYLVVKGHGEMEAPPYPDAQYRRAERVPGYSLRPDCMAIAQRLLRPFLLTLCDNRHNPFPLR